MEYQVPQFIEVEDKLIGPLTLRQFIYLAGAGGICVIALLYLPFVVGLLVALLAGGFGAALAFYKVNSKPFVEVLEDGFNYYTRSKLFLWKHSGKAAAEMNAAAAAAAQSPEALRPIRPVSRLTSGKLSELAWSLDVEKGTQ
ncbi:MAG TPA: PrgI family protein [Candidatus Paceibacterota bacterium]|nr:PrgI family protein [Candidatus Paceibacterota bacterium]